jgi:hypothetical protein
MEPPMQEIRSSRSRSATGAPGAEETALRARRALPSIAEIFWDVHVPRLLGEHGRDTGLGELSLAATLRVRGDGGGTWSLRLVDGVVASVGRGELEGRQVAVSIDAGDFAAIAAGELDHRDAFFAGRIEIEGDTELALWAATLIPTLRERFPFRPESCLEGP